MPTVDLTRIGSNIGAMYSLQSLLDINNKLATTQQHLSTGKRINSASDDPAGLTIATKMNARSVGLKVVQDNISDATNMMSVAEAGLNQLTDIVTQMRSKATQAANDTLGNTERAAIQTQLQQFSQQIDDILTSTKWNGVQLLSGNLAKTFQTGVDQGETTVWNMNTNLAAGQAGLKLSNAYTSNGVANETKDATTFSGAAAGAGSIGSGTTELTTGGYTFNVMDKATSATQGKLNLSGTYLNGITGVGTTTLAAASAGSLVSGNYTVTVTGVTSATDVSYTITSTDTNFGTNGTLQVNHVDLSSTTGSSGILLTGTTGSAANTSGVQLTLLGANATNLSVGSTMSFEYIAQNQVKMQLLDGSGNATSIDTKGGTGATHSYGNYGYINANSAFDTGRGLMSSALTNTWGNINVGANDALDYHRVGNYVVDVSSASKASSYMNTANSALDTINTQLATLGSLMARMQIKATAASSAQINVEAAYNRIMNANMAEEQVNASKYQVLQQTSVAMLAQSNQAPQAILSLFK